MSVQQCKHVDECIQHNTHQQHAQEVNAHGSLDGLVVAHKNLTSATNGCCARVGQKQRHALLNDV
jgi:hypothetical protein